ncbi:MAG: hypothetical protein ACMXYA_01780, partial [Candidatus Woesearchaeota archaeon]
MKMYVGYVAAFFLCVFVPFFSALLIAIPLFYPETRTYILFFFFLEVLPISLTQRELLHMYDVRIFILLCFLVTIVSLFVFSRLSIAERI